MSRPRPAALALAALQAAALVGAWWLCDRGGRAAHLPIPGSVLGLGLLVLLLGTGLLPLRWVKAGADLLLGEMLLFFIPAVVAAVNYPDLLLRRGWQLLVIILVGTAVVMLGTALAVEGVARLQDRLRGRR